MGPSVQMTSLCKLLVRTDRLTAAYRLCIGLISGQCLDFSPGLCGINGAVKCAGLRLFNISGAGGPSVLFVRLT